MVAWTIWSNRNDVRLGKGHKQSQVLVDKAFEYLEEFQASFEQPNRHKQVVSAKWSLLPPGRYKMNVDGAISSQLRLAGIGVVIRDEEGKVVGACCKKIRCPLGALEIEAKAVEFGLCFAKDCLVQDIIVEGDSQVMINALKETSIPPSSVVAIVYGCLSMSHSFCKVDFSHVGRNGNMPAHLLAKHALSIADFSVWIKENPCLIEQALIHDISVASSI